MEKPIYESGEIWKSVNGFDGLYEVSNKGNVARIGEDGVARRLLKPVVNAHGYAQVCLSNGAIHKTVKIHRLVASAFIPNESSKTQVNHIDGDKTNNDVSNLEWATPKENIEHSYKSLGYSCHRRKLSDEDVRAIRKDRRPRAAIAEEYGVAIGTVSRVRSRRTFKGVV